TLEVCIGCNVVCVKFLESSTVVPHDPQHLYLATIQVVMNVNSCTEGSLTCTRNDDQTRRALNCATHSSRELVEHFNVENVERRPVKNQPENILMETNMQVGHMMFSIIKALSQQFKIQLYCLFNVF